MYSEIPLRNFTVDNKKTVKRSTDTYIVFGYYLGKLKISYLMNYIFFNFSINLLSQNFMNNHMHTVSFDN